MVRWFVQYNPMFTASALCVLGGVFLLARALGEAAVVPLTAVLELYQWLLIGVAALLYRRLLERRPAVILGVIELVLLTDPTLQLSALATAGQHAGTLAWVALFAAKVHALMWAFRLRASLSARALPIVGAAVIAFIPVVRVADVVDPGALRFLLAAVVFVLGWVAATWRPTIASRQALGEHGLLMFPRLVRAAAFVAAAGFVYQACNASLAEGLVTLLPSVGAVLFVVAAKRRDDAAWAPVVAGAFLCAIGGGPSYAGLAIALPMASIALASAYWRGGAPRLVVGALSCTWLCAIGAREHVPAPVLVLIAVAVVVTVPLAAVLWRRAAWSAIPALAVVHLSWTRVAGIDVQPHGPLQWGGLLVLAGFVLLPLGVVMHRRLTRILDEQQPVDDGRSTSAAVPLS